MLRLEGNKKEENIKISLGSNSGNTGYVSFLFPFILAIQKTAVLVLEALGPYLYLFYLLITVAQGMNRHKTLSIFSESNLLKQR